MNPNANISELTIRTWLAGLAMQGLLACEVNEKVTHEQTACEAVRAADTLMRQLVNVDCRGRIAVDKPADAG